MKLAALLVVVCTAAGSVGDISAAELQDRLEQDFRMALGPEFQMFGGGPGAGIRANGSGLQINLARDRDREDGVGVATRFRIRGDFEVTLSYALLSFQKPEKGFGAGLKIWFKTGSAPRRNVTFAHLRRPKSENEIVAMVATFDADTGKSFDMEVANAVGTSGQLRLTRIGSTLHFLAMDDQSNDFREVHQADIGVSDIEAMRIQATGAGASVPVSVRLHKLAIRAEQLSIGGSRPLRASLSYLVWTAGVITAAVAAWLALRFRFLRDLFYSVRGGE